MSEIERETVIQACSLTDFVHKNGMVLQKDIRHCDTVVRMSAENTSLPPRQFASNGSKTLVLPDPYTMRTAGSLVHLSGQFDSMSNITVTNNHRRAEYKLPESVYPEAKYLHVMPQAILIDSLLRFGAIHGNQDRTIPVYVPVECKTMKAYFDFVDFNLPKLSEKMIFSGVNPHEKDDEVLIGPVEATDLDGNIVLAVEGGVCKKFGEIKNAF